MAGGGGAEGVTLVCTGSLTNAALLLTVYPEVKEFLQVIETEGSLWLLWLTMVYLFLVGGWWTLGNNSRRHVINAEQIIFMGNVSASPFTSWRG